MFCTACATANPRSVKRCTACGAALRRAAAGTRRTGGRGWTGRGHLALAIALPVAMLLTAGGYWRAELDARAAAYARGEDALATGDPEAAIAAFADAGGYRDATARLAATRDALDPYRALYQAGVTAVAGGDPDAAIAALLPVVRAFPAYRDATALLAQARVQREAALERELHAAREGGDWLAAERVLALLVASDPANEERAEQLAALRRDHAPLLFGRDGALYLIGPDGEDERVILDGVPAAWPVWSPDRSRIAFSSPDVGGQLALYVVDVDGSGLRRLGEWLRPYEPPVWSPDGTRLAYLSTAPIERSSVDERVGFAESERSALAHRTEPRAPLPAPALRVVEVETGVVTDPTDGRVPSATFPSWSPSGDRLAFVSRPEDSPDQRQTALPGGEVYVVTLATGEIVSPSAGRIAHPWRVAWSPTQEAIVVWTRAPDQSHDAERTPLYLIDTRTGSMIDLNPARSLVTMPVWSPDGRSLAYLEQWTRLRVRSLDGRDRTVLLPEAGTEFLSWSPDGSAIIVAGGGQPSLVVRLAGEGAGQTTTFAVRYDTSRRQAGPPQWSPLRPIPDPRAPSVGGTARDG